RRYRKPTRGGCLSWQLLVGPLRPASRGRRGLETTPHGRAGATVLQGLYTYGASRTRYSATIDTWGLLKVRRAIPGLTPGIAGPATFVVDSLDRHTPSLPYLHSRGTRCGRTAPKSLRNGRPLM